MNVQRYHEIAVNLLVRRRQAAFSRGRLVGVCPLAPFGRWGLLSNRSLDLREPWRGSGATFPIYAVTTRARPARTRPFRMGRAYLTRTVPWRLPRLGSFGYELQYLTDQCITAHYM